MIKPEEKQVSPGLLKLRAYELVIKADIKMNFKQEKFIVEVLIGDYFLLDYLQKIAVFDPMMYKAEKIENLSMQASVQEDFQPHG